MDNFSKKFIKKKKGEKSWKQPNITSNADKRNLLCRNYMQNEYGLLCIYVFIITLGNFSVIS